MNTLILLQLLLLHLAYIGSGCWLAPLLARSFKDTSAFIRIPLLYFAGVLAQVLVLHVPLVFGHSAARLALVGVYAGLGGLVLLFFFRPRTHVRPADSSWTPRATARAALTFVILAPAVAFFSARLISLPDVEYDPTAFWFLKTKLFLAGDHFWSESFQDPLRLHSHQNYPIYFPLFALQHMRFTGVVDDWIYKPGMAVFYSMGIALVFGLIRERLNVLWAALGTGILLYSPVFCYRSLHGSIYSTYADFPLALMMAGTIGTALIALEKPCVRAFVPAAVLGTSTFLIKTEGLIFVGLLLPVITALLVWRQRTLSWGERLRPAVAFVPSLLLLAGWVILRSRFPDDSGFKLGGHDVLHELWRNVPPLLSASFKRLIEYKLWGLIPFLIPILLATSFLQRPFPASELSFAAVLVCYFGGVVTLFLFMEIDSNPDTLAGLMNVTFDRIVIQVLPALLLVALAGQRSLKSLRLRS